MNTADFIVDHLALAGSAPAPRSKPGVGNLARPTVILAVLAATVAGFTLTGAQQSAHAVALAGPDLTRLLRAMAALKTMMAVAAVAAVLWRLAAPANPGLIAGYTLACAAMGAGPGLIWGMDHVGMGALLLHAGLAASVLLLWRDPGTSALLAHRLRARSLRVG